MEPGQELSRIVIEQVQEQDSYRVRLPVQYQLTTSSGWSQEIFEFTPGDDGTVPRQQAFEVAGSLSAVRADPFFEVRRSTKLQRRLAVSPWGGYLRPW